MPDYSQAKVYMLKGNGLTYIGSTCQPLNIRLNEHRYASKSGRCGMSSIPLFNGDDDVTIELLEACPCKTKDILTARERYHIEHNDCVNKLIPGRTVDEWYQANRDRVAVAHAEWRRNKIDMLKTKVDCPCGGKYTYASKRIHSLTKRHMDYEAKRAPASAAQ